MKPDEDPVGPFLFYVLFSPFCEVLLGSDGQNALHMGEGSLRTHQALEEV